MVLVEDAACPGEVDGAPERATRGATRATRGTSGSSRARGRGGDGREALQLAVGLAFTSSGSFASSSSGARAPIEASSPRRARAGWTRSCSRRIASRWCLVSRSLVSSVMRRRSRAPQLALEQLDQAGELRLHRVDGAAPGGRRRRTAGRSRSGTPPARVGELLGCGDHLLREVAAGRDHLAEEVDHGPRAPRSRAGVDRSGATVTRPTRSGRFRQLGEAHALDACTTALSDRPACAPSGARPRRSHRWRSSSVLASFSSSRCDTSATSRSPRMMSSISRTERAQGDWRAATRVSGEDDRPLQRQIGRTSGIGGCARQPAPRGRHGVGFPQAQREDPSPRGRRGVASNGVASGISTRNGPRPMVAARYTPAQRKRKSPRALDDHPVRVQLDVQRPGRRLPARASRGTDGVSNTSTAPPPPAPALASAARATSTGRRAGRRARRGRGTWAVAELAVAHRWRSFPLVPVRRVPAITVAARMRFVRGDAPARTTCTHDSRTRSAAMANAKKRSDSS